jgi:diguanylate cyclase (GGDEF)-like protein
MIEDDGTESVPSEEKGVQELRILRAALEVSRLIEPAENASAIVTRACSLTGGEGGLLYLLAPEGGEHHLLGCHAPANDARRKGLVRLRLAPLLATEGFSNVELETGPSPPVFAALGFDWLVSASGEESDCHCRLLLGFKGSADPVAQRAAAETVARLLSDCLPGLANCLRMERVRELVIKDDQTESYNRRHLDSFLTEEVERARRYGTVLSLIFLDLDNLKEINSLYGHAAGSRSLRELARRVMLAVRGSDKLFRYGGDEFCVVLPETDAVGALELAERLRQTIASRPFELEGGQEVSLTASFGLACFPLHGDSAAGLLAAADRAMSRVKQSGKNSIGVGTDPLPGGGATLGINS